MGKNAQRRRAAKRVDPDDHVTPATERSRNRLRLRIGMSQVRTLAQFEHILEDSHPDHRESMRRLLEPMLRKNLPCCGAGMLALRTGETVIHAPACPTRKLVVVTH